MQKWNLRKKLGQSQLLTHGQSQRSANGQGQLAALSRSVYGLQKGISGVVIGDHNRQTREGNGLWQHKVLLAVEIQP